MLLQNLYGVTDLHMSCNSQFIDFTFGLLHRVAVSDVIDVSVVHDAAVHVLQ
jgi:hypothetical protein